MCVSLLGLNPVCLYGDEGDMNHFPGKSHVTPAFCIVLVLGFVTSLALHIFTNAKGPLF